MSKVSNAPKIGAVLTGAGDESAMETGRGDAPAARGERALSSAARRALAEAAARRGRPQPKQPREVNGRGGPDPVRYGDWEVKGIASDF